MSRWHLKSLQEGTVRDDNTRVVNSGVVEKVPDNFSTSKNKEIRLTKVWSTFYYWCNMTCRFL